MIVDTMTVMQSLHPEERRALADFCYLESSRPLRQRDQRRMLRALAEACEALDTARPLGAVLELDDLRHWIAAMPPELELTLLARTDAWLQHGRPEELVGIAELLRHPPVEH